MCWARRLRGTVGKKVKVSALPGILGRCVSLPWASWSFSHSPLAFLAPSAQFPLPSGSKHSLPFLPVHLPCIFSLFGPQFLRSVLAQNFCHMTVIDSTFPLNVCSNARKNKTVFPSPPFFHPHPSLWISYSLSGPTLTLCQSSVFGRTGSCAILAMGVCDGSGVFRLSKLGMANKWTATVGHADKS